MEGKGRWDGGRKGANEVMENSGWGTRWEEEEEAGGEGGRGGGILPWN